MTILKHIHIIRISLVSLLMATSFMTFQLVNSPVVSAAVDTTTGINPKKDDCKVDAAAGERLSKNNCGIIKLVIAITNIMGGLAATVIVGTLVFGGIQYSMAGADPSKVQAAKQKVISALTALMLLIFGFAILQWLVPGGVV